jgi:hypothetical protein
VQAIHSVFAVNTLQPAPWGSGSQFSGAAAVQPLTSKRGQIYFLAAEE